jgi:drug/metabolite transporter (DMT)-like permease
VKPQLKAVFILLAVALVCGASYPTVRWAVAIMDPIAFSSIKFLMSAAVLLPFALRKPGPLPKKFWGKPPGRFFWLWAGLFAGLLLALETVFLYVGMVSTASGKAAFIANMNVLVVPLIAIAIGRMPGRPIWLGLVLGVVGVWLLSSPTDDEAGALNIGDALVFGCACFRGLHIVMNGRFANRVNLYRFVTAQLVVTGLACGIVTLVRGTLPSAEAFWLTLPSSLFGIFSVSFAIMAQTAAQRSVRATEASLTLLLEAVFAAIIGVIFLNEVMTAVMWLGAVMMVAGAAMGQIHEERGGERRANPAPAAGKSETAKRP